MSEKIIDEAVAVRVTQLIQTLGISKNEFARNVGISSALISKITNKQTNFGVDIAAKIISTYPRLSSAWLLTGIGDMWNKVSDENSGLGFVRKSGFSKLNAENSAPNQSDQLDKLSRGIYMKEAERSLVKTSEKHWEIYNSIYGIAVAAHCLNMDLKPIIDEIENITLASRNRGNSLDFSGLFNYLDNFEDIQEEMIEVMDRVYELCTKMLKKSNMGS